MSEEKETFNYGDAKVVGTIPDGKVHFVTVVDGNVPFALVFQEGNTDYSPDHYNVLYGTSYVGTFDDCSQILVSPNNKYILYVVEKDEKHHLYKNNLKLKANAEDFGTIDISNDSENFGCFLKTNGMWELHENNTKFSKSFTEQAGLVYLPDGNLAFLGENDGIWNYYTTIGGKLPIDFLKVALLFKSPISDGMAFFSAKNLKGKWEVYMDYENVVGPFDGMGLPMAFSSVTKNHAYTGIRDNVWYVFVNNKKIDRAFSGIDYLSFLPNGEDIVCSEVSVDGTRIYINEKLIAGPFERLGFEMSFSPDCKRVYYSKCTEGKWSIGHTDIDDPEKKYIKDMDVTLPCSEVMKLLVSPDLSKIVYSIALKGRNMSLDSVVSLGDLGTFGVFQTMYLLQISKDSSTIIFASKENNDWYIYVNGKKVAGPFLGIPTLTFFKDTSIILYRAYVAQSSFPAFMLYMDGKNYVGHIDDDKLVYMEGEKIILKERIR